MLRKCVFGSLTPGDIDAFLTGLGIMGTGGGGATDFGREIISNDLVRGRKYNVVSPDEVPDDALVVSGGILGSVKAVDMASFAEVVARWENRFEPQLALKAMEEYLGRKVDYLVPFELGGLNTPVILSLGARTGIPVINGDGLGRAAPETQMTSFAGHGISIVPMPMVDWAGNLVVVKTTSSPFFPDKLGRFMATQTGGMGANIHYPMTGELLRKTVVPGTLSFAYQLGSRIGTSSVPDNVAAVVAAEVGGRIVFQGRIGGISEENAQGFLVQTVEVHGGHNYAGSLLEIVIKNEFMLAIKDGKIGCIFPDLILVLDERGKGMMSSELIVGQKIWVVIAPCHPRLRMAATTPLGRHAMAAARFGREDVSYKPVEELSTGWGVKWQNK